MRATIKANHPVLRRVDFKAYCEKERDIVVEELKKHGYEVEVENDYNVELFWDNTNPLLSGWFEIREVKDKNDNIIETQLLKYHGKRFNPNPLELDLEEMPAVRETRELIRLEEEGK